MYSLVIPVYKNEGTIEPLVAVLDELHEQLESKLQVVFVVDGSPDRSHERLRQLLPKARFSAELVCLSRNFGSFAAIRMGLTVACGPYFAVMAADLQEPPELIVEFFQTLASDPVDVVVGARSERNDPPASRWMAQTYWSLYRRWIQRDMPTGGVDVFACNQAVRSALLQCGESNSTLVGLLVWLGFRRKEVFYVRQARLNGRSAWTFRKKLRYMFDSMFAFSDLPIWALTLIGCVGTVLSVVASVAVTVSWLMGNIPILGYVPVVLAIMLSMFLQMLSIGVIGGYVWRAFENTKRRPLFVPMSQQTFRSADNNHGPRALRDAA